MPNTEPTRKPKRLPIRCRSEEHTSELQSRQYLVCRLLLEKKNIHRGSRLLCYISYRLFDRPLFLLRISVLRCRLDFAIAASCTTIAPLFHLPPSHSPFHLL